MPLYDYACRKCGQELEARQKMTDDPLKTCPKCGEEALERLVSKTSFALKGSGWYADGYGAKAADSKDSATPATKSTDVKSSETKSADTKSSETKSADTAKPAPAAAKPDAPKPKDSGD